MCSSSVAGNHVSWIGVGHIGRHIVRDTAYIFCEFEGNHLSIACTLTHDDL